MAQMAVAWVLQNDNVASAITGGSRPEQVKDNAAAAGKSLLSETLAGIDEILGDSVERDGSLVGSMSPEVRPT
jgi:aryl-alcohol dehydrogenase-like predicted oxidoreductase